MMLRSGKQSIGQCWQEYKYSNIKCKAKKAHILTFFVLFLAFQLSAQQLAFPGAEGFGRFTKGGRGGKVLFVENLNDSGPGSLREALNATGPRTVVFNVGGTIKLRSNIVISDPFVTIAGQTAPGDGVLITGYTLAIKTHEVIIRNIRVRKGAAIGGDAIVITPAGREIYNIILDHVSVSWGSDENIGINGRDGGLKNLSIQNSIIGEGLRDHSMGVLLNKKLDGVGPDRVSIHKNLFVSNQERNPMVGIDVGVAVINNLVHNWTTKGSHYEPGAYGDVLYNKFVAGQDTRAPHRAIESENAAVYLKGNDLPEGIDAYNGDGADLASRPYFSTQDYGISTITNMANLESQVLSGAGAFPRDAVDRRYVNEYKNRSGKTIYREGEAGGFPQINGGQSPADSDRDGMSDSWERNNGTNPSVFDANNDKDGDGYTNLEEYLNCLMEGGCSGSDTSQPGNTVPVVSDISNITMVQDTRKDVVFSISDQESSASQLQVTASSDVVSLFDQTCFELSGTGTSRTLTLRPKPNTWGSATVSVKVSDGQNQKTESFTVRVTELSGAPQTTGVTSFTLVNADNGRDLMQLTDGQKIPKGNLPSLNLNIRANVSGNTTKSVVFGWNGDSRFQVENDAPYTLFGDKDGSYGSGVFKVGTYNLKATPYSETQGNGTAGNALSVRFEIVDGQVANTAPTMSYIEGMTISKDTSTDPISFKIGDAETDVSKLVLTATCDVPTLVEPAGFVFGGTGNQRTLTITPRANTWGSGNVTVKVSDGERSASRTFKLVVSAPDNNVGALSGFSLMNASNDTRIKSLADGETINLAVLPTRMLNIRTNHQSSENIGSVLFGLNDSESYRMDNTAPFSMFGDTNGDFKGMELNPGTYVLKATPYSGADAKGIKGTTTSITIRVIDEPVADDSQITGFVLLNSDTDRAVKQVKDGEVIDIEQLSLKSFNIQAVADDRIVKRIVFDYNGEENFRTEDEAPYSLFGDFLGDYHGKNFQTGKYTIEATPYDSKGNKGVTKSISFTVVAGIVSSSSLALSYNVAVYPNPFVDHVNVDIPTPESSKVFMNVYDNYGNKVLIQTADTYKTALNYRLALNTSVFKSGEIYHLYVYDGSKTRSFRLVKR